MPIDSLPTELLRGIISLGQLPDEHSFLLSCCLVCRRWLALAQPLLFEILNLDLSRLTRLHRGLTGSSQTLGLHVRALRVHILTKDENPSDPPIARMLADCLQRTTSVIELDLYAKWFRHITNQVIIQICGLQRLEALAIGDGPGAQPTSRFDRDFSFCHRFLLRLPGSLKELTLIQAPNVVLDLVPTICELVHRRLSIANTPSYAGEHQSETQPGLRLLFVHTDRAEYYDYDPHYALFQKPLIPSLSSTLTQFSFDHHDIQIHESILIPFLAHTPLLEHLSLGLVRMSPSGCPLFDGLPPLRHLRRFFMCGACGVLEFNESQGFCQSLKIALSHSPELEDFEFQCIPFRPISTDRLLDCLLDIFTVTGAIKEISTVHLTKFERPSRDVADRFWEAASCLDELSPSAEKNDLASLLHDKSGTFGGTEETAIALS